MANFFLGYGFWHIDGCFLRHIVIAIFDLFEFVYLYFFNHSDIQKLIYGIYFFVTYCSMFSIVLWRPLLFLFATMHEIGSRSYHQLKTISKMPIIYFFEATFFSAVESCTLCFDGCDPDAPQGSAT